MSPRDIVAAALDARQASLDEFQAKQVLAAYDVPVCREGLAADGDAAVRVAAEIGYPVVLKAIGPGIAHKTEHGLIELGLTDDEAVRAAAARLSGHGGDLLVQEMVAGGRELLLGMKRDPQYGPCLSFGLGGVFAEALDDVALALAPVDKAEALALLGAIRAKAMLGAWRGMLPVNSETLAGAIVGLSRLALEIPEIREIDINPLIVVGDRPVAVDALVVFSR